jgi:hypothetical protein
MGRARPRPETCVVDARVLRHARQIALRKVGLVRMQRLFESLLMRDLPGHQESERVCAWAAACRDTGLVSSGKL